MVFVINCAEAVEAYNRFMSKIYEENQKKEEEWVKGTKSGAHISFTPPLCFVGSFEVWDMRSFEELKADRDKELDEEKVCQIQEELRSALSTGTASLRQGA